MEGRWLRERRPPGLMFIHDPIVFQELPVIQKIIEDETWLEGERRGRFVAADDPVVQENVCVIILMIGGTLRARLQQNETLQPGPVMVADRSEAA